LFVSACRGGTRGTVRALNFGRGHLGLGRLITTQLARRQDALHFGKPAKQFQDADELFLQRELALLDNFAARGLEEDGVADAARADGLAVATVEAETDVLFEGVVDDLLALGKLFDEKDAPARGFGLKPGQAVRRAVVETQAAVDTAQ
jgi:hypothetical protein